MAFSFGNCDSWNNALVKKGETPHTRCIIRDLHTRSNSRICSDNGSTDYLMCVDADNKLLLKHACQARYRARNTHLHIKGKSPIYCFLKTNNDGLVNFGLNNVVCGQYGVKESVGNTEGPDKCGLAKTVIIPDANTVVKVQTRTWPNGRLEKGAACRTHVVAPPNHWVVCDFNRKRRDGIRVQHSGDPNCERYGLTITDSLSTNDKSAPALTKLCGIKYDGITVKATGNMLTFTLNVDQKYHRKYNSGFQFHCRAIKQALWFGAEQRSFETVNPGDVDARDVHERDLELQSLEGEDMENVGGLSGNW